MNRRTALIALLGVAGLPREGRAYLLPQADVLRRAQRRLGRGQGLQVGLVGLARADDGAPFAVSERWIFGAGAHGVRVDVHGPDGRLAHWQKDGAEGGDAALLPDEAERHILGALFAQASLEALCTGLGVDRRVSSLALQGERVAYVIGAQARQPERPQVWIDQDDFAVLRVRFRRQSGAPYELRLDDWIGPPGDGAFPQRLQVIEGGHWRRRLALDQARLPG